MEVLICLPYSLFELRDSPYIPSSEVGLICRNTRRTFVETDLRVQKDVTVKEEENKLELR
jgi:hypothetical protein